MHEISTLAQNNYIAIQELVITQAGQTLKDMKLLS
jgi:hypothetical protein